MKVISWKTVGAMVGGVLLGQRLVRRRVSYAGKTVLITGASRGLGLELARAFAKRGARLVLCARNPETLERAKAELEASGASVFARPCDVTDGAQVERFLAEVKREVGAVDVLVNVAGVIQVGPARGMSFEDFDRAMATHFFGPLRLVLGLKETLLARKGQIINIASVGGKVPAPHLLPYDASKFALVGLSEGLHVELAKDGVHTVCPGLMRTGSPRNAELKGDARKEYGWFKLADSLPYLSIGSTAAAEQILEAAASKRAELFITGRAALLSRLHGVAPSLTLWLLSIADRFLPREGSESSPLRHGRDVESPLTRSPLAALTDRAAEKNNEVPPGHPV